MDLLDRLSQHDVWTTRQLLLRSQELGDEELDRDFDIGHRSVRATFLHIIRNMEVWSALMSGQLIEASPTAERSVAAMLARLDRAAEALSNMARAVGRRGAWDECFVDTLDRPPTKKTFGGGIGHIITHSMHHRAQLLYLLRRLGVKDLPEGDVLGWEQQARMAPVPSPALNDGEADRR